MKIYDTLIIGSGYTALGYALARGNSVIATGGEVCDASFSLTGRCFALSDYEAKNPLSRELLEHYKSLGLISGGMTNTGALECGFCDFALARGVEILLKCRVIAKEESDEGIIKASVIGGGGIEYIYARRVLDMREGEGDRYLTVLFTTEDEASDTDAIKRAYSGARIEPAFYEGRFALHIPVLRGEDINSARVRIYEIWDKTHHTAKLLYTAPMISIENERMGGVPKDSCFGSFLRAFDAGVSFAEEALV